MSQPSKECPRCHEKTLQRTTERVSSGALRWKCYGGKSRNEGAYCYSTTNPDAGVRKQNGDVVQKRTKKLVFKREIGRTKTRVLVSAAQNATPGHKGFIKGLEVAADYLNADIAIVPIRYKNPTSRWTKSQANEEVWADEVQPYLVNERKRLNQNLQLLADIKVQPTAISPLTGFAGITHGESGILAHTKVQFETVAVPGGKMPKIMTTTGACTVPNYTDSKAGALGAFHHTLGAVLVELDGRKKFHLRQINANKRSGGFIDLNVSYNESYCEGTTYVHDRARVLAIGDLHADYTCRNALAALRDQIAYLNPEHLIWHDVSDSHTVTPHHRSNPFAAVAKWRAGRLDPLAEIHRAIDMIAELTPKTSISHIVFSNHPEMVARFVRDNDWRLLPPEQREFYLRSASVMLDGTALTEIGISTPDPFNYWARKRIETTGKDIRCLESDESLMLGGIEYGYHGHYGPSGARGTIRNMARVGVKIVDAHEHGPGIFEGHHRIGTMTKLVAEYTHGPGRWLNTNSVQYVNGKRSLLNSIGSEWRLR